MAEPNHNGRATIREVYALVGAVEERLADQLREVEQRLVNVLKGHEQEHDRAARRGRGLLSAVLTVVGLVVSLGVGVVALVLR